MADLRKWKHTGGYEVGETLPTIQDEDNGKVLGVSEGQYALVNGGGGGGAEPLIVDLVTEQSEDERSTYLDETGKNIYDAYLAGTPVIIKQAEVPVGEGINVDYYVPLERVGHTVVGEQNSYLFRVYIPSLDASGDFYAYGDDESPTYAGGDSGGEG